MPNTDVIALDRTEKTLSQVIYLPVRMTNSNQGRSIGIIDCEQVYLVIDEVIRNSLKDVRPPPPAAEQPRSSPQKGDNRKWVR